MANVNKKYLEKDLKDAARKEFFKEIKKVKSHRDLKAVMEKFFSPTEQIIIEKRLMILYLLNQGLSYRKIGNILDVPCSTISFVKNGFTRKKRINRRWQSDEIKKIETRKSYSKFPKYRTLKAGDRWRFLR
jgi:uncharacterized protein YerC